MRDQIWNIVQQHSNNMEKKFLLDEYVKPLGHKVLRLPPYHCQYNAIEMVWSQTKRKYDELILKLSGSVQEVLQTWERTLGDVSPEQWKHYVSHTNKVILEAWDTIKACDASDIPSLIITEDTDESDTDEYYDSDGSDDEITNMETDDMNEEPLYSEPLDYTMDSVLLNRQHARSTSPNYDRATSSCPEQLSSEDECFQNHPNRHYRTTAPRSTTQMSVSSEPPSGHRPAVPDSLFHGNWQTDRTTLWSSEPTSVGERRDSGNTSREMREEGGYGDASSVMSFASSSGGIPLDRGLCSPDRTKWSSQQQLETKIDVVHGLLSMLGSQEHVDMGETLLALSACPESCVAMRQSGCIPLLVQLVQSDKDQETRRKASSALHNLVNAQPDENVRKREVRILKLLEHTRAYIEAMKSNVEFKMELSGFSNSTPEDNDRHPDQTIAHLMKLSFDEGHRQAICQLGGIHTIATLVEVEHTLHGSTTTEYHCILMRRYACMALTNLAFGDSGNKALLCSFRDFMRALVVQLGSSSDELRQVTASVLRNLSWKADSTSKEILKEVGSVTGLMKAAMMDNKENTLKSILSALWNLSAHCTENKSEICAVEGALGFLVQMLTYKTPSKSLAIIENAGGILRNISSQIAVREDYREILRRNDCLRILLDQLKSPSLTIVSNACGTLWNLSAKNTVDQEALWEMGAPTMLRSLNHSKHKMIAMGSSAALKNLLTCRPNTNLMPKMDSTALSLNLPELPTLGARKQRALLHDLDNTLSETFDNIEQISPIKTLKTETSFNYENSRNNSSMDDLNRGFESLNINQPSTSKVSHLSHKNRIPQPTYGSSSLPYVPQRTQRTVPCSYIPNRAAFAEDDTPPEQPIDYSQKYSEKKPNVISSSNENVSDTENFSLAYAETDLDQPTDYSLRYAEDDSDSEMCHKISKQEYVQDTVKTYCTEGTPYETPYVISNATSMSDLRNLGEKTVIDNDAQKNKAPKVKETKNSDEKDRCSTEDISDLDNSEKKVEKIEFNSGMMSPDKPVNYCEEGTPGYFSRVSSFGSLNSIEKNESNDQPPKDTTKESNESKEAVSIEKKEKKVSNEPKAVKFEENVNYAEETPLMFSRTSSLASLDSIEQHSIHDDRSSVISDFSRLTSGIISPSDLPDSPTQTVPPSPKPRKTNLEFPSTSKNRTPPQGKPKIAQRTLKALSVFEDGITKFKEESTPIQFSTATSLSSLTIDDGLMDSPEKSSESKSTIPQQSHSVSPALKEDLNSSEEIEKVESDQEKGDKEKETSGSDLIDDLNDDESGDEDILAACINDGMQTNMANPTASSTPTKLSITSFKYQPKSQVNSGIPMLSRHSPTRMVPQPAEDAPKTYCTEDTPAHLSRTGSNSNLSLLSIPTDGKSKKDYLSDDSSNLSGDNENLLAECIQSVMPKSKKDIKAAPPRKITPPALDQAAKLPHQTGLPRRTPLQSIKISGQQGGGASGGAHHRVGSRRQTEEAFKMPRGIRPLQNAKERRDNSLPPYLTDEVENYAVESTPCQFSSLRSSLSDLTVDGSVAGVKTNKNHQNEAALAVTRRDVASGSKENKKEDLLESPPREANDSLSSLSSLEGAEQALLEQCIYSVMPTDANEERLLRECILDGMPKSSSSSQSNVSRIPQVQAQSGPPELPPRNPLRPLHRPPSTATRHEHINHERQHTQHHHQSLQLQQDLNRMGVSRSKNGSVASAAKSTDRPRGSEMEPQEPEEALCCPLSPIRALKSPDNSIEAAGVQNDLEQDQSETGICSLSDQALQDGAQEAGEERQRGDGKTETTGTGTTGTPSLQLSHLDTGTSPDRLSPFEEILSTDQTHNGSEPSPPLSDAPFIDNVYGKSCEETGNLVDNRMLDPDAMIESLDRFTAELVSQASHLNKDRTSNNDNTWNDETSTNDVTMSESVPNIVTFNSDKDDSSNKALEYDAIDGCNQEEKENQSNDFSSVNTSTMTASTLIAIEANKMASAFQSEAEMSQSITGGLSLDLDSVRPPSQLNSMTNSAVFSNNELVRSPKVKRKPLSHGVLLKRALSNPMNHSVESIGNNSVSALDNQLPPSDLINNLTDMENSTTSIASLPTESGEIKPNFIINAETNKNLVKERHNPIFDVKRQYITTSFGSDLELVNPPSIFNDITDMCNSLADVRTETMGTETECFEDCNTHVDASTLQEDPTLEYSDANSITPIHTDISSAESTPKKSSKNLTKSLMTKQKRNMARDRYKTYTVAAEMLMKESQQDLDLDSTTTEDYKTVNDNTFVCETTTFVSMSSSSESPKLTPKERRRSDRSRYETQVLDKTLTSNLTQQTMPSQDSGIQMETPTTTATGSPSNSCSPSPSPTRSKLSIRRNFLQKRLDNQERFRTQTISESSFSPDISSASPPSDTNDIHFILQKEANLVLKGLRDTKHNLDLDCETLSLVSNDEDSDLNSGSSMQYRTYHKSWSLRPNLPVVTCSNSNSNEILKAEEAKNSEETPTTNVNCKENGENFEDIKSRKHFEELGSDGAFSGEDSGSENEGENDEKRLGKPKIVKPDERQVASDDATDEDQQPKGIRGRRKPLYSKTNVTSKVTPKMIKPSKTVTSNLVKNVTSTFKSTASASKQISKPPVPQNSSPRNSSANGPTRSSSPRNSPRNSTISPRNSTVSPRNSGVMTNKGSPKHAPQKPDTPVLERQGTFTKDDSPSSSPKHTASTGSSPKHTPPTANAISGSKIPTPPSRIPSFASKIARAVTNRLPSGANNTSGLSKSASTDRAGASQKFRAYNRSTSADSRTSPKKLQPSSSTQSLRGDSKLQNGHLKKSGIPSPAQRSHSNLSTTSTGSVKTKQVTSKIASLWKRVEQSKTKQQNAKDTRVWIQNEQPDQRPEPTADPPKLIRSNTFENKNSVILRNKANATERDGSIIDSGVERDSVTDPTKRISRLGSFIISSSENSEQTITSVQNGCVVGS